MKNFKNPFIILILLSSSFGSCSKDLDIQTALNERKIIQNLQEYCRNYLELTILIDQEFGSNYRKSRKFSLKNDVLFAKTETEIKTILERTGIKNGDEIIGLIKKRLVLENNFRLQNPDFYFLNISKRTSLLNQQYDLALDNYIDKQNSIGGVPNKKYDLVLENYIVKFNSLEIASTHQSSYNLALGGCNINYGKSAALGIVDVEEGLVSGVIVGVIGAWDLSDCKKNAQEENPVLLID